MQIQSKKPEITETHLSLGLTSFQLLHEEEILILTTALKNFMSLIKKPNYNSYIAPNCGIFSKSHTSGDSKDYYIYLYFSRYLD